MKLSYSMRFSLRYELGLTFCLAVWELVLLTEAVVIVPYNTTHYFGPDGPWQAVSINVSYHGEDSKSHNFFPAIHLFGAALFAPDTLACGITTAGDCGPGGLGGTIAPLPSNRTDPAQFYTSDSTSGYTIEYTGDKTFMTVLLENGIYFTTAQVAVCDTALYTYPSGVKIPTAVGLVGLGGK